MRGVWRTFGVLVVMVVATFLASGQVTTQSQTIQQSTNQARSSGSCFPNTEGAFQAVSQQHRWSNATRMDGPATAGINQWRDHPRSMTS